MPKILIVEDNENTHRMLTRRLTELNHVILEASNGKEAIERLKTETVDVILLDQMMSNMDGIETFEHIKEEFSLRPPVMMMTAHATLHLAVEFLKAGGDDFIQKPLDFDILDSKMQRMIATNTRLREIAAARLHAEESLAEERHLLQTIIGSAADFIYAKDVEGRYTLTNPSHARSVGKTSVDEVIGKATTEIYSDEQAMEYETDDQTIVKSGQSIVNKEEYRLDQDGQGIWLSTTKVPLRNQDEEIIGIVGVSHNITTEKRAEDKQQANLGYLLALQELDIELAHELNMESIISVALDTAVRLSFADSGFIGLIENNKVRVAQIIGNYSKELLSSPPLDIGIVARAIHQQQAEMVTDVSADPDYVALIPETRAQTVFPLISHNRLIGVLNLETNQPTHFTEEIFKFLKLLAVRVAVAIDNSRMIENARRRADELEVLHKISVGLAAHPDLDKVIDAVLDGAISLLNEIDNVHFFLYQQERLTPYMAQWSNGRKSRPIFEPRTTGLHYAAARQGERIIIDNMHNHPLIRKADKEGSLIVIPLKNEQGVAGVMSIYYLKPRVFQEVELHILDFLTNQAAIAIGNAQLFRQIHESEERYRDLFENAHDMIQSIGADGHLQFVNQRWLDIMEYSADEIQTLYFEDTLCPDEHEHCRVMFQQLQQGNSFTNVELRFKTKTGREIIVEGGINSQIIDGEFVSTRGIFRDITKRKLIESALIEERNLLKTIINQIPYEIYVKDASSRFTMVNRHFVERYHHMGISESDIIGQSDFELFPLQNNTDSENARRFYEQEQSIMQTDRPIINSEIFVHNPSHEKMWLMQTKIPINDQHGETIGLVGINQDITKRKQDEQTLREQEQHYRALFEGIDDAVFVHDIVANILDVNKIACHRLGYTREELLAMKITDLATPEFASAFRERLHKQLDDGQLSDITDAHLTKDGRRIDVDVNTRLIDYKGQPAILAVARDITQRKQAEDALQESEARFRTLVHTLPHYTSIKDRESRFQYASPNTLQLFGMSSLDQLIGKTDLDIHPPELAKKYLEDEQEILRSGQPRVEFEEPYIDSATGEQHWSLSSKVPLLNDGEVVGLVTISIDITERKRGEEQLREAKAAAEAANRAKSTFLSNMSHELRTPLNAILGFAQLMEREDNNTALHTQRKRLITIQQSGEHLLKIINDVLEMSRIEAGHVTLNMIDFDLHMMLNNIESILQQRARNKVLTLSVERDTEVPRYVRTDEMKLRQVLINLVANAIKFTDNGTVVVHTSYQEEGGIPRLRFDITDSGRGIAETEITTIFTPFEQSRSEKGSGGTGLGLPISRQFIQLMGGDISVTSEPEKGSIFTFDISIELGDESNIQKMKDNRRVHRLSPDQQTYRILVVEDQSESREMLSDLLQKVGFGVREAINGQEAIEIHASWKPHLILMDMQMPIMGGYEATKLIKKSALGINTVIIALTAGGFEHEKSLALDAGCDDFISKPFRHDELLKRLSHHLSVNYLYDDQVYSPTAKDHKHQAVVSPEQLAALPQELVKKMYRAAETAQLSELLDLVEQIRAHDETLAIRLSEIVNSFEFERLVNLTETWVDDP